MKEKVPKQNNIDEKHFVNLIKNDCNITLYFTTQANKNIEDVVLNLLVDCFENRVKLKTC